MTEKIWVVDDEPSTQYPIYTRGNVGEVFPEAVAPLSWSLAARPGSEAGWRDAYVRFGAFNHDEFDPDHIENLGCFGGYAYLNVSLSRILAVRTPGLTPELMDQAIFGTSEAPPYAAQPTDESPAHTERVMQTIGWVLTQETLTDLLDDQRMVDELVASRPDFSAMGNREILEWARSHMEGFRHLFGQHIFISYAATVPVGMVSQICAELGDPTMAMRLVTAVGDVDSAAPSYSLWDLSRAVASSPSLTAAFDAGVDGLLDRLRSDDHAATAKFVAGLDDFLDQFGSRGPNEWEMRAPTWGTHPELALAAIDRMRFAPDSAAPQGHWDGGRDDRETLTAELAKQLEGNPEVQGQFLAAVRAAGLFLAGRERSKTTVIKFVHEARLAFQELGRRMVAAGHFDHVEDFGMLTNEEWDGFLDDPTPFRELLRARTEQFEMLQALEPPFIINGKIPPLSEWRRRGSVPVEVASPGQVLAGIPGCPGTHTGRARVVLSPGHPDLLEPGDVLIAPITDPAWTPLFVPAGAVIVDVGAQVSHAVIVSRELGIPCVVSVTDATRRIPDGAMVTVDGTAGTVTLL